MFCLPPPRVENLVFGRWFFNDIPDIGEGLSVWSSSTRVGGGTGGARWGVGPSTSLPTRHDDNIES